MKSKITKNNSNEKGQVRFAIPSNSRMYIETREFLTQCGYTIQIRDRQYIGTIKPLPEVQLVLQRQKDILHEVERGSISFAIIGSDVYYEYHTTGNQDVVIIHNDLGFGKCKLGLAVPIEWKADTIEQLISDRIDRSHYKIATKYTRSVTQYLQEYTNRFEIVPKNGSVEVAPTLGYSDMIADLISSGETLRANNLKLLKDGILFQSQAILIGNRQKLQDPSILDIALQLLESFEAALRGKQFVQIFANVRQSSPNIIMQNLQSIPFAQGLQGPTISPVYLQNGEKWHSIHILIPKNQIREIIRELRQIGGSGVVISPVNYIFEEEPERCKQLRQFFSAKGTQSNMKLSPQLSVLSIGETDSVKNKKSDRKKNTLEAMS